LIGSGKTARSAVGGKAEFDLGFGEEDAQAGFRESGHEVVAFIFAKRQGNLYRWILKVEEIVGMETAVMAEPFAA
jgi:hypothetical protein